MKIRAEREWVAGVTEILGKTEFDIDLDVVRAGGEGAMRALAPVATMPAEVMLQIVLAYDKGGTLGGRDFLEENADSAQIYGILVKCFQVAFPFASSVLEVVDQMGGLRRVSQVLMAVGSASPESDSTNGHSPTGTSDRPRPSKKRSTAISS